MFALTTGVFFFLVALLWHQKTATPPDETADDPDTARKSYHKALRQQALVGIARLLLLLYGGLVLLLHLLTRMHAIEQWSGFALLLGIYSLILLAVQRSEVNRRLASLLIMGGVVFITVRYATYRGWAHESDWAIYGALSLNYLFWLLIGRRYPVGSSQDNIKVWGMDESFN